MAEETASTQRDRKLAYRIALGYGEAAGQYLTSGILSAEASESAFWLKPTAQNPVTIH